MSALQPLRVGPEPSLTARSGAARAVGSPGRLPRRSAAGSAAPAGTGRGRVPPGSPSRPRPGAREELDAEAAALAAGPVDVEMGAHRPRLTGGAIRCSAPTRWCSTSARKVRSALRTIRMVPLGWWQAPRPSTEPQMRRISARATAGLRPVGQVGEVVGDRREPVAARPALAGVLAGQVASDIGRRSEAAAGESSRATSTPAPGAASYGARAERVSGSCTVSAFHGTQPPW